MPTPDRWDTFKAHWKLACQAEEPQREKELEDLRFEAGEHWKPTEKDKREKEGKPVITIDLLSGPIKQVINQIRHARPGIQISPVGQGADPDKAEAWQGIIRRVERLSRATRAYLWAGQHQAKMGRGFWIVRNVEVGEDGEQDIRIEEIVNQHTVYCDPTAKKLDGSDKKWAILFEDLTHDDYIARFGESKLADALGEGGFLGGTGDSPPEWITANHCRIAEHFVRETTTRTRLILSDGSRVWEDELEMVGRGKKKTPVLPDGVTVVRAVKLPKTTIQWCLYNGMGEVLEETTIPGDLIPVVMVWGERRVIDGETDYRGLVRMAIGPSRMEDFCESSLMESIREAKTAPWIAEWDQISEFRTIWETSHVKSYAVLPYRRISGDNGAAIPPPQRVSSGVDVSALTMAAQRMQNHVKHVTGTPDVFQEETGADAKNASGRAILARRAQAELVTSDYLDNVGDGVVLTAKIIMSMAREVYDTPRLFRILGEDEQEHEIVTYKGQDQRAQAEQMSHKDLKGLFDLSVGEYDIAISVGKNYQTARQESVEAVGAAVQAYPPIAKIALPILFKNSDWPGAQELAKALDPDEQMKNAPPELIMKLQQADQMLQMAQQRIQELEQAQAGKVAESQGKAQLAQMQAQFDAMLQRMQGQQALELENLRGTWKMRLQDDQQAHDVGMAGADAAHTEDMADKQHVLGVVQQDLQARGNGSSSKGGPA